MPNDSLGAQPLKGFDEPIEVYRVGPFSGTSILFPEPRRSERTAAVSLRRGIAIAAVTLVIFAVA